VSESLSPSSSVSPSASSSLSSPSLPLIETLQDNFNDNSLDTSKWDDFSGGINPPLEQNNCLELSTQNVAGDLSAGVWSDDTYNLVGSYAKVELIQAGGDLAQDSFYLDDGTTFLLQFYIVSGILYALGYDYIEDVAFIDYSAAYNSTNHRFLRIRETSGTVYFEVSTNGTDWNAFDSAVYTIPDNTPFKAFLTSQQTGPGGDPTTAIFDRFNTEPIDSSVSPSASVSLSLSPSSSASPSLSPSASESASLSPSASVSPSLSPSASESRSLSPSASISSSLSPSSSISVSLSPSASFSPSASESSSLSPSASVSISPSASASASYSPSASVSPSPSQEVYGIADDITITKIETDIQIRQLAPDDIYIIKQSDDISIIDTENTISGSTPLADEIIIQAQEDDITIIRPTTIDLIIRD
jgi:hypothetical protein